MFNTLELIKTEFTFVTLSVKGVKTTYKVVYHCPIYKHYDVYIFRNEDEVVFKHWQTSYKPTSKNALNLLNEAIEILS